MTEARSTDISTTVNMDETTSDPVNITKDPFAAQRTAGDDPFANQRGQDALPDLASSPTGDVPVMNRDRRMSKEWDASKVPPSRFQRREGSIYATPSSRDAHTGKGKDRDQVYHDKLKEKGWVK